MRHIYAKMETNFPQDARMKLLTPQERWVYICIWCLAVANRTEDLPPECCTSTYLAHYTNTHHNTIVSTITKASNFTVPLLKPTSSGGLTVCGVTKLHPSLFRQRHDTQENTREENTSEHNTTLKTQTVFDLDREKTEGQKIGTVTATEMQGILDRWQNYSGQAITSKLIDTLTELVTDHGVTTVKYAMSEAFQRGKTNSLAYVRVVCKNNAGKLKDATTIADILKGD